MSLLLNLMHAEAAVKYVEQHLRGRASNKPEDIAHTLQAEYRQQFAGDRPRLLEELGNPFPVEQRMQQIYMERVPAIRDARDARRLAGNRLNAAAIIADGIGNCFEHSVVACSYLNGKNVPCYMVDTDEDTNHVFVVIGLPEYAYDGDTVNVRLDQLPPVPFDDPFAVVCDPWYHEWFSIQSYWTTKMHRILATTNKRPGGGLPATIPLTLTGGDHVT